MLVRPLMPIERNRRHHTLRVVVVAHTSHTTGMLWWERTHPSVKVRFIDEDYTELSRILQKETRGPNGDYVCSPIEREVEVIFTSTEKRDSFAVGEEVWILFSTAGAIDQFFTAASPFRWDGLKKK